MSDTSARFLASISGAFVAETMTLPADVIKVRLQVQTALQYHGLVDCGLQTYRAEGPTALWKGLSPALLRQISYTSLSMVLYEPIRNYVSHGAVDPSFFQRFLAGGTAGAISIAIFNPTEVLKTQIQTAKEPIPLYHVARNVYRNAGIVGFWAGVKPNVMRTFLVNAAELGTYDYAKFTLTQYWGDGFCTHVGASGVAGLFSACVSTPADVVKTRLMNQAGGRSEYSGILDAVVKIGKTEGASAFYKGFLPICLRKLIWCSSFFVCYEQFQICVVFCFVIVISAFFLIRLQRRLDSDRLKRD